MKSLVVIVLHAILAGAQQVSMGCASQAAQFFLRYNDSGTPCANELYRTFTLFNTRNFSEITVKCFGQQGMRGCFLINDAFQETGVNVLDTVDDCALCRPPPFYNRTACQTLLGAFNDNITAEAGSCSTVRTNPESRWTDQAVIVSLLFTLDIKCSGVYISDPRDGFMRELQNLRQCQCGAIACAPGLNCRENTPPEYCPEGHYCPGYGDQIFDCPEGYFCPKGATEKIECRGGSVCPIKSGREYQYVPFLLLGLALLVVYLINIILKYQHVKTLRRHAAAKHEQINPASPKVNPMSEAKIAIDEEEDGKQSKTNLSQIIRKAQFEMSIEFENLGLRSIPPKPMCPCITSTTPYKTDEDGMVTRLTSVTGKMPAGTLTGIMGPSGSGKSTFLNVLCGKLISTSGVVKVNGKVANLSDFRKRIGFVPQHDIVEGQLKVEEALMFSAGLRLRADFDVRRQTVEKTLKVLGLIDVRDSIIGDSHTRGISGGEKKRVNVGLELVGEPSALFLDEPTTGLDATAAMNLVEMLRRLAKRSNITVAAVIHQPRPLIVDMFDSVILLVRGGQVAYVGHANDALAHFTELGFTCADATDIPDYLSDVISGLIRKDDEKGAYETDEKKQKENVRLLVEAYLKKAENKELGTSNKGEGFGDPKRQDVSIWVQLTMYIIRGFKLRIWRTDTASVTAFAYLVGGIVVGIIFNDDPMLSGVPAEEYLTNCPGTADSRCFWPRSNAVGRFGFYNVMCLGVVAIATATATFSGPRKIIFWRESSVGASGLAYFLGENIVDSVMILIYSVFYASAIQLLVQLRGSFALYWSLWTVFAWMVNGISYIFSIGIRSMSGAMISGVVVAIVLSLFNGFVPRVGDNAYWCYTLWAGRACSNIEYIDGYDLDTSIPGICKNVPQFEGEKLGCYYTRDDELVSYYDYVVPETHRTPNRSLDFGILIFLGLVVRIIAFILLKTVDLDKQR
ncbi:hypothetical protein AAMO2058_000343900 [Amorphochlora amoebiformis]